MNKLLNANKRKGYCTVCHYTVYIGEGIVESNKLQHLNCGESLRDLGTRRTLNPRVHDMLGNASRKKVVSLLERMDVR